MVDSSLAAFGTIVVTLFLAELTDKDALLLLAVSTRTKARVTFLAGAAAFTITTTIIVSLGSILVTFVPVNIVRLTGGAVMIAYGVWELSGAVGQGAVQKERMRVEGAGNLWKEFVALLLALILLDLAGDATEILTIVLVAQYRDPMFVFSGVVTGLVAATAVESTLGSRLGRLFTPRRVRLGSAAIFLALGMAIVLYTL